MDKMITAVIGGEERQLNYSVEVMFNMTDKFGSISKALEAIDAGGKECFETVRWFAVQMANDAELCRRAEGYDARPMITPEAITLRMRPVDFELLTAAVVDAISLGYRRETEQDEEVDLGLAELNAKKAQAGE